VATKKKKSAKTAPKKSSAKKSAKKAVKVKKGPAKGSAKGKTAAAKSTVKETPKKPVPVPPKKPALLSPKNSSSRQYTQSELYECIRGYCGFYNRSEAKNFYGGFMDMIQAALKSGFKVVLPGLGKIQVKKTKARMGRNPATQQPMMIPARRKVAFTPLKALKEAVL